MTSTTAVADAAIRLTDIERDALDFEVRVTLAKEAQAFAADEFGPGADAHLAELRALADLLDRLSGALWPINDHRAAAMLAQAAEAAQEQVAGTHAHDDDRLADLARLDALTALDARIPAPQEVK